MEAFASVFSNRQNPASKLFDEVNPGVEFIKAMYSLDYAEIKIIANILRHYPDPVTIATVAGEKNLDYSPEGKTLNGLVRRGFLKQAYGPNCRRTSYVITTRAYEAFLNGEPLRKNDDLDCYEELKNCMPESIDTEWWLSSFNEALSLPINKKMKNACDELGILSLPNDLQMAFWGLAKYFIHNFSTPFSGRSGSVSEKLGLLCEKGLCEMVTKEDDSDIQSEYCLPVTVAGSLFRGRNELIRYDELAKYATIIKNRDIKRKELFFSNEAGAEIGNLGKMLSREGFERAIGLLKKKKRPLSIQSLLWGPPGTGKTESVKQLALASGRDIVLFDVSKVTFYGWGNSEKGYRAVFRAYKYVAAISDNAPIFLMNEADAILSKRLTNIERAIDKGENNLSNIMLEEMENFNGILLATTNLFDIIDPAFERRFLFKTRLIKPDATARTKIWKSSIPELTEDEAHKLADTFEMSGAQIDNVVVKRDLAELYYEGDRGYDYIVGLCEKELSTENGTKSFRPRIGY